MKKFHAIALALLLTGFATVVFAAPPEAGSPGPQGFNKHWARHTFGSCLNLTKEQREKMREVRQHFQADVHDLKYDIRIRKLEARKLFTDPKTDDATLLAKEKELNGLKLKFMDRKAEMKVEWRKILTPEQIRMLERIHRHHHGRHHHRGPMGKWRQSKPAANMGS
jgi:Spy/CpxP family protein refolding chaperone